MKRRTFQSILNQSTNKINTIISENSQQSYFHTLKETVTNCCVKFPLYIYCAVYVTAVVGEDWVYGRELLRNSDGISAKAFIYIDNAFIFTTTHPTNTGCGDFW